MKQRTSYLKLLPLVAVMAMLPACREDDCWTEEQGTSEEAIRLQAVIEQQNTTRVNDSGFADGDAIGVFIVNYDGDTPQPLSLNGNHADNVRFTYDHASGEWTGSYPLYWKDKTTPVDAYGYYPFNGSLPSVTDYPFSVQRNQRDDMPETGLSGYEASDFLWAKAENVSPTAGVLTLQHKHIMAGIKVVLVEGNLFEEGEWETLDKSVLMENVRLTGSVNLQAGTVTVSDTASLGTIIPQTQGEEYRIVGIPQTVEANTPLFAVTVDGISYHHIRTQATAYFPGKLYRFTIKVNKGLTAGDYTFSLVEEAILPWENDPLSHNGTAREYITVNVEEGEYIGDVITRMGLDPQSITNLKLTGTLTDEKQFSYIRNNMPNLEAINLKEVRTKAQKSFRWESGWGTPPYDQPAIADDYLPMNAFENMAFLSYVVWPEKLQGIGDGAFAGCNLRGGLIFPEGLKHIGGSVFEAWNHTISALSGEIYLPSTVEYIGGNAFSPTDGRTNGLSGELTLPARMKFIGPDAFTGNAFLTGSIRIPEGLTVVEKSWAPNMTGDVIIPQGVKTINGIGGRFSSIYIPEGVEGIGNEAFQNVSTLKGDQHLPSTLKTLGSKSFYGTGISHINLPEGLEIIESETFRNCTYLQDTITLPSTITQIRSHAFADCRMLTAVILPENLEEIQDNAFLNCYTLDYIQSLNPTPPVISGSAFNGVEKNNFTLVVPEGAVDAYRNAEGWKEFKRISTYRNFVCRPMQAKLLNKGNVRTVILNADGNWNVTHCPDWAHVSPTSGYKKTELTVTIDELGHGAANRTDSIIFTLDGQTDEEGNAITTYYKISQFDYEYDEDSQIPLQTATQGNGINIVFTGDGYDAEDIAKGTFLTDIEEGMEYFFGIEPYKTYKEYFNVYADMALSYESGVCSNVNMWRETKFSITYGAGKNGRLSVDFDKIVSYSMTEVGNTALNADNINQSLIICIANSDAYEGLTSLYASGAAVAVVPHSRYDYPNDYRGLIQHEAGGHGFGKLGDEYVYHRDYLQTCPCQCCGHVADIEQNKGRGWFRNLSLSGKYSDIEWRHLIFDSRYSDIVDIYEGGYMHGRGIYRSESNSCMNNNIPYYSTVSRQAIVERIMDYAGVPFSFEEFAAKDSREMGDKFLTRSQGYGGTAALHNPAPVIKEGNVMKYVKRNKYNIRKR